MRSRIRPAGRLRRLARASAGLVIAATSTLAVATPDVAHASVPPAASRFVPMQHLRIVSTLKSRSLISIPVAGNFGLPANVTEIVANVTIVGSTALSGVRPYVLENGHIPTDALHARDWVVIAEKAGQTVSNLAHLRVGSSGYVYLQPSAAMKVLVDLEGYYVPVAADVAAGRYIPMAVPAVRALSAIPVAAGASVTVDLASMAGTPIPASASAVLVNLRVDHAAVGDWSVYAHTGARPSSVALVTDTAGQLRSNQAIVALEPGSRELDIWSRKGGNATLDVLAWFTGADDPVANDGLFIPAPVSGNHVRVLDTRLGRAIPPVGVASFEYHLNGAPTFVGAMVANLMWVGPWQPATLSLGAAGTGSMSSVNAAQHYGQIMATSLITAISNRGAVVSSNQGGSFQVDVAGWYMGTPLSETLRAPVNPAQTPSVVTAIEWTDATGKHTLAVERPSTAKNTFLDPIADRGKGAAYNDLSTLGKPMDVIVFAHRTKMPPTCNARTYRTWPCSGIFRNINSIKVGNTFRLRDARGHWWTYLVAKVGVTKPTFAAVVAPTSGLPPATAQLIACSLADGNPTSYQYRIVVTGRLIGFK